MFIDVLVEAENSIREWMIAIVAASATILGSILGSIITWLLTRRKKKKITFSVLEIEKGEIDDDAIGYMITLVITNSSLFGKSIYELSIEFYDSKAKKDISKTIFDLENYTGVANTLVFNKMELLNVLPEQSYLFRGRFELLKEENISFENAKTIKLSYKDENGRKRRKKIENKGEKSNEH